MSNARKASAFIYVRYNGVHLVPQTRIYSAAIALSRNPFPMESKSPEFSRRRISEVVHVLDTVLLMVLSTPKLHQIRATIHAVTVTAVQTCELRNWHLVGSLLTTPEAIRCFSRQWTASRIALLQSSQWQYVTAPVSASVW